MLLAMWTVLGHAACVDGACPPSTADAAAEPAVAATAPIPAIDRDRPDDIRTAVFALG